MVNEMSKENVLLTFIVPAYNVERYISECLDSLVNQTMYNHKVIIVNDGSTDKTEEICLNYQKRYPKIFRYICQENKGLGETRNVGMRLVDTPYLTFLDSDDWLSIKFVEKFSQMIAVVDELPDMVFTLPWVYDTVSRQIYQWKDKDLYDRIFDVIDGKSFVQRNCKNKPELLALEVSSCRKIYKKTFLEINKFSFPKGLKWEDVLGHFLLVHQANNCMALPEVGFIYRINQGGQITAGGGKARLDLIPIFKELLNVQDKYNFIEIERAYVLRLIVDFSIWSIEAINLEYITELLEGLHEIFQKLPEKDIDFYLKNVSPNQKRERGFITLLRGHTYLRLKDYLNREAEIKKASTNLIRGGVQCVKDHGVVYTTFYAIKKYVFRRH